jgi:hypothetical protein
MFQVLGDDKTGLHFVNSLKSTQEFNMFDYMYFYNGAGWCNKGGLIDLSSAPARREKIISQQEIKIADVTGPMQEERGRSIGG